MDIVEYIKAHSALVKEIHALELKQIELRHECSHKYPDGTDATVGVPVSGERWCPTCRTTFD